MDDDTGYEVGPEFILLSIVGVGMFIVMTLLGLYLGGFIE